ncbi:MAG: hypothetical protein J6T23_02520 [Elusimicrobia bacterium]|nr:hypothetical protein [Elusimicrobiota bacterium]
MIIKANKQIGFIYKNNESIDKILKDGNVVFERGFLREKTSTTLPINFGGVGKDLKDYKVYGNTYQNSTSGKNICLQANIIDTNTIRFDINSNEINRIFTLSLIPPLSVNSMSIVAFADGVNLRSVGTINLISGERSTATITLTESIYNTIQNASEVHFNLYKSGAGISTTSIIEEPQIENNSSFTSYEPYTGGQPSPNPNYPQEIISCGDRTKNLLQLPASGSQVYRAIYTKIDDNSFKLEQDGSLGSTGYVRLDLTNLVKPNTTYVFSREISISGYNFINEGSARVDINGTLGSVIDTNSFNIVVPSTITRVWLYLYIALDDNNLSSQTGSVAFNNVMLEESSTATPYEPYGYKIPVNVRSDNLFDKDTTNKINAYFESSGDTIKSSGVNRIVYIPCKPNTTYAFSKTISTLSNRIFQVATTNDIPSIGVTVYNFIEHANDTIFTYTTNSTAKYIVIRIRQGDDTNEFLSIIQIVEGSTVPDKYIPYYNETTNIYLDEPLRGIGEYSDYIDFINGKVVRQLGENIPNLNDLSLNTNYTNVEYVMFLKPTDFVGYDLFGNYHLLCSHAIYSANPNNWDSINNVNKLYTGAARKNWWIGFEKGTGLDTIKQKLEGCSVIYRLATPTEETITLPNIPTVEGNNKLNIETEITPSQVYIKYKSNT